MGMLQTPKRKLHHVEAAPFTRKVCMVKADVMETIVYGCVCNVHPRQGVLRRPAKGAPRLPPTYHWRLAPTTHRPRHVESHGLQEGFTAKASRPPSANCASSSRGAYSVGPINDQPVRRYSEGWLVGIKISGPARPNKNGTQRLTHDLRVFRVSAGSTKRFPWCSE